MSHELPYVLTAAIIVGGGAAVGGPMDQHTGKQKA